MIDYAAAGEWLEAYGRAWQTFDGDAWVGLFTEDAEYHEDPFGTPLVGHNALRAYLLEAAASETDVEFTVERHWASGDTLLAAFIAARMNDRSYDDALRSAVATSAASVLEAGPGRFDPREAQRLAAHVALDRLEPVPQDA